MKHVHAATLAFTLSISAGAALATEPSSAAEDLAPQFAVDAAKDTLVTWWCDLGTGRVHARKFSLETLTYGPDRVLSRSTENARNPEIAYDGDKLAIVYEVLGASTRSIAVGIIGDEPDPIPTLTVRTTNYTGEMDAQVHVQKSHLWVTWIDDASYVGWSEYSHETQEWSTPTYESYAGSGVTAARSTIQSTIVEE